MISFLLSIVFQTKLSMKFQICVNEVRATLLEFNENEENNSSNDFLSALDCASDVIVDE